VSLQGVLHPVTPVGRALAEQGPLGESERAISSVRHRSFRALRLLTTLTLVPHATYLLVALRRDDVDPSRLLLVVALEVAACAAGWLLGGHTHRIGSGVYIAALALLAFVLLSTVGLTAGAALAFAGVCVAAAIFFGMRAGVVAYVLVALQLAAYALWLYGGGAPRPFPGAVVVSPPLFVRYALAVLSLIGVLLATVTVAVHGYEAATRELGEALARERAEHQARQAEEAERVRLERAVRAAQRLESLGRLAGGVIHDFNNALGVILACAGELAAVVPADRRADLDAITETARSTSVLTRRLLSLARHGDPDPAPVEILAVLRRLSEVLRRTLPKNVAVVVQEEVGSECALVMTADRASVEHAVLNLSLNARDAMPDGGTLSLACRARTLSASEAARYPGVSAGPFVELAVEDTGTGIPADVLPRVFEPLFTTKAHDAGTGLGLSSVLTFVRSHGGAIEVRTEPGKGSRFTLLLPAAAGPASARAGGVPPHASPSAGDVIAAASLGPAAVGLAHEPDQLRDR
jgi:signal transduction histidine kinase